MSADRDGGATHHCLLCGLNMDDCRCDPLGRDKEMSAHSEMEKLVAKVLCQIAHPCSSPDELWHDGRPLWVFYIMEARAVIQFIRDELSVHSSLPSVMADLQSEGEIE